jgi:hypothetical protein
VPQETRKFAWIVVAVLMLFCQHLRAAVPDWARQAAAQPVGTYDVETKAVVLLDETSYTVTAPGEYVQHHRRAVRILRPDGRDEGELGVHFGQKEKLLSVHAWTVDSSGREYELKDKDFMESSPYAEGLYDDIRFRVAKAPASAPGSVIAFEYEVHRHAWLNQLHWFFQDTIPVREARLTLNLPPGWEFKSSWAAASAVQPSQVGNGWQWTVRDVPGIEHEPMMPAFLALSGRMELAYFDPGGTAVGSWDGLGRWYSGLTNGRRTPTPEISEKVRQLTAGKTDFDGKLRALTSFMQSDVRYVGIWIGIGGYQPHPAGDVFHARYGDCKDKATLLSSMLQEAGIGSEYVLIDTERGTVHPDVPSAWFNHAILAVELPKEIGTDAYHSVVTAKTGKRYLIFDPTDEYTPVGELRSDLQDSYALLITDSRGELILTPTLSPDANIISRTGHFILSSDGTLVGEVVENRSGDHARAVRHALIHANQQQRLQHFEHQLSRSLRGFTLQSTDIQQLDQSQKNLVLTFKFTTPQYGQVRGPLMLLRPRVLGEKGFDVERKLRHYPVELEGTSRQTDVYEIEIPQDYKVDDVPDPVKIDVGFASYQSKIEVTGSKLRYSREYVIHDLSVNPDHMADLRKLEGTIGDDEAAAVVLKRVP